MCRRAQKNGPSALSAHLFVAWVYHAAPQLTINVAIFHVVTLTLCVQLIKSRFQLPHNYQKKANFIVYPSPIQIGAITAFGLDDAGFGRAWEHLHELGYGGAHVGVLVRAPWYAALPRTLSKVVNTPAHGVPFHCGENFNAFV